MYYKLKDRGEQEERYPQKTIGDLKVGDFIYDENGKLTEVLHLNPIIFEEVYEVELEDGEIIKCNQEHLWSVYDKTFLKRKEDKQLCLRSTDFLYNNFKIQRSNGYVEYRFHIPCCKPIDYPNIQHLSIPPYILGAYLGDGCRHSSYIVSGEQDAEEMRNILLQYSDYVTIYKEKNKEDISYLQIDRKKDYVENGVNNSVALKKSFKQKLKQMGLDKNKYIPDRYLYAPIQDRIDLLCGLMDTDGTIDKEGHCEFTQVDYTLIKQVSQLLSSLGIKNNITYKEVSNYIKQDGSTAYTYRIHFRTDKELPCFKLARKYNRLPEKLEGITKTKAIVGVRKTGVKKPMRCITVSNESGLFLCGNHHTVTHNSFLTAPYVMTRSMLIPSHETYIMSVTGPQAQTTFRKMEDLALGKIASVANTNTVFLNEVVKQNSKDSGFTHDKNSFFTELYNHSKVRTLNSVPKNIVGIRSNLNVYDEAGKISQELFDLSRPFVTQNTEFITGSNLNIDCYPSQFPNQILYCSSAEDVFTELWRAYKEGAKEMIMGNPEYFVCDISCEFSFEPKMNGKPFKPLLARSVVEQAMAQNAFRANREYYNKFDVMGGQDNLVSKAKIDKCSQSYFPVFEWEEGKKYIIVNDPSSKIDNSFILVAELFLDEEKGYMCKIINGHNLVEPKKDGTKKVIQKPKQVEILKDYLVKYNGPANDYDNLEQVIIDAGAGGGGFDMYQFILPGWTEEKVIEGKKIGVPHVGIIDLEDKYCKEERDKFPEAKDILTLANFKRDKVYMYEAASDALNQELIIFPKDSTGRGEMEFEEVDSEGKVMCRYEKLNSEQLRAVVEIEMLKYELMAMEKTKNSQTGKISFDLMTAKKAEGLHDDRADCVAMLCYYLMQLRAKNKMSQFSKAKADHSKLLQGRQQINQGRFGGNNPFLNRGSNPFL